MIIGFVDTSVFEQKQGEYLGKYHYVRQIYVTTQFGRKQRHRRTYLIIMTTNLYSVRGCPI